MAAEPRITWQPDWVVAPGEILQEALDDRGMSQSDLARRMGRPIKTINEIVNGKAAITPDTADPARADAGIWPLSGTTWRPLYAHIWRVLVQSRSSGITPLGPRRSLSRIWSRHNLIEPGVKSRSNGRGTSCLLRVSTPEAWKKHWLAPAASFRASPAFASRPQVGSVAPLGRDTRRRRRNGAVRCRGDFSRSVARDPRLDPREDFALQAPANPRTSCRRGVALVLTPEFNGPTSAAPRAGSVPTRR